MTGTPTDESAKRGIATHLFMQFCDLARVLEHGTDRELERLCKSGFISEKDKDRVRRDEIAKFASSELLRSMLAAKGLHRELRFNVRLPAELFTEDEALRGELAGEKILVQGVIDCIIENADGSLRLIDYKTDRLSREELDDPELARAVLAKKHSLQLYYYSLAVESIFGKKPSAVEVYSLPLGRTIRIL
jgi:ATP-dependent helicase/nuclease subunit A